MIGDDDILGSGLPPESAGGGSEPDGLELDERQIQEMRTIFATSLPQYLDPLEQLCHQLLSGGGDEVFASFRAAATSLREAADHMSFSAVSDNLLRLENAVAQLPPGGTPVDRDAREVVLGLILDLRQLSEDLGASHDALKGRALVERLAGMPGAAELAARLARAGLVLDVQLVGARPDEIAAVSGLTHAQVDEMLAWLAAHPEPLAPAAGSPRPAGTPAPGGGPTANVPPPAGPAGAPPDEAQQLADETAALSTAIERLGARLEEAHVDIARSRSRIDALRGERKSLAAELDRRRKSGEELERWLVASANLRAQLLAQRDLYTAARHEAEQRLERRREQLAALVRSVGEQRAELGSSQEALSDLDSTVRTIRARFGRERGLK